MPWPFTKTEATVAEPRRSGAEAEPHLIANFVGALPDPALAIDRHGMVIAANEAIGDVLEVNPAGHHLTTAIRAPAVLETVAAVLAGGAATLVEYELRFPLPRHFDAYVSPLALGQSSGLGALIVLKDLTREQRIERMRADFVANASHELRTPLASLSGFIETLLGAAKNDVAAREKFLGLMGSQAERMKRLIDDLLSLSRIELNQHLRPSATVDLAQIARHVADVMAGMAKAESCEIRLDLPDALPVAGDRDELVQVVQNLVENALKYAGTGKFIEITGRSGGGQVELSVRDHGPGIAAEHLPRLTERFYRVSVEESRSRGGTGLGLAIVKHILNRHRGRLEIVSEPGHGSAFTVRIPKITE